MNPLMLKDLAAIRQAELRAEAEDFHKARLAGAERGPLSAALPPLTLILLTLAFVAWLLL